ncbi:Flotillin-2a [Planktothrix agardhii]|jgi:flotillin|uniref:Band 7 protein n=2 Tax=Planktothrix agardhii TaxID=1160 RepID=A0A1J1JHK2_PLAAG|nr:SPFH domain-containing protein [Planktothrix agardhii]CAD5951496.1 Flotillin-2a [Planktothrix agardhii]CAD5956994.1 Flotillin-2a [Planktothrix agardhii]CUM59724.1 Band 7 protein [Planktothrix agardhii]
MTQDYIPKINNLPMITEVAQVPNADLPPDNSSGSIGTALPVALSIFGIIIFLWFLNTFLQICKPNEILILSGRKRRNQDGQELGYRVIFGGRTMCIPILETVKTMDLRTMPVRVEVKNAYSKGGTPLNIQAIANVKISNDRKIVGNAIERFLERDRSEISRVAKETLEGNLRGVVGTLTPEQLNEDRLQFAESIAEDVSRDLSKLGLQLDTLKIQSVSDDVDYLNSIGRRQIALIVRDAEIAESNAMAEAEQTEADCRRQAEVAKTQAQTIVLQKGNELRKIKAELEQQARSEEERTTAAGEEARAKAEQLLQTVRAELERLRLESDEVLPADAQRQAKELRARGEAASLIENALAAATVTDLLNQVWKETGSDASELFNLQQIEMILREAAKVPNRVKLKNINVIDSGDGKSVAGVVNIYPEIFRQFLETVEHILGVKLSSK